jgi:branched-chain amino acid aminotransferase
MIVWLNDALTDAETARIDPADRGFLLGDGLFETIALRSGKILRLESHLARLKLGCELLQFLPYPLIDFKAAIEATSAANQFTDAAIRLTLTRGAAPRGLLPPGNDCSLFCLSAPPRGRDRRRRRAA